MMDRPFIQAGRRSGLADGAILAFCAAVVCWTVLSLGLTAGLNFDRPFASVMIYGGSAETRVHVARLQDDAAQTPENVTKQDPGAASGTRARAEAALRADPLSVDAFQQLGRAAEQAGDGGLALRNYREVYRRTFREANVTARLLEAAYNSGDFVRTIGYSDGLLRERPELSQTLTPLLAATAEDGAARKALAQALALEPVWRPRFLAAFGAMGGSQEVFDDLMASLKASSRPMVASEVGPYLNNLLSRSKVDEALTVWLAYQPESKAGQLPLLVNGDFMAPINDLPFNWSLTPSESARVGVVDAITGADGKAVEIEFLGRRGGFANLSQVLALTPGRYRIRGKVRTDDFRNPRGMFWRVYCGVRGDALIAETERIRGELGGWRSFTAVFDVPANKCAAQLLRLELAARIPTEQVASGAISFAELSIDRQ